MVCERPPTWKGAYKMRYNNEKLRILGKQDIHLTAADLETIKAIIEATERDPRPQGLHDKLFDVCIDAFNQGYISGKRAERAKRSHTNVTP